MLKAIFRKENSNLAIFVVLVLLALHFLYAILGTAFRKGMMEGRLENTYYVPEKPVEDEQEIFDHNLLMKPTPELIALGKKVFTSNCVSCHGEAGKGDGAAGQKLATHPRDYHAPDSEWKNGTSVITMYHTLEKGTGLMPNFPALNPKQKYAVIHYVHNTFMKERGWKEDTPADIAGLPKAGAAVVMKIDSYAEQRVPIKYAMEKITVAPPMGLPAEVRDDSHLRLIQGQASDFSSSAQDAPATQVVKVRGADAHMMMGWAIFSKDCASCHGAHGEGTAPRRVDSALQLKELAWGGSLLKRDATWANDYDQFRSIVSKGIPNGIKPGFATFTDEEMKALFDYTESLRQ